MPGKIISFYSYKGGVGRSMALANIAVLIAKLNKKVLIVDWDLEAPGLYKFFIKPQIRLNGSEEKKLGIVDLLTNYKREGKIELDWKDCLIRAEFENVGLDILTAGMQNDMYQNKVQDLNWEQLFNIGIGSYLNSLRNEWIDEYDFIFVDSRTGITDIGDICTVILPDIVVLLFVSNYQNR